MEKEHITPADPTYILKGSEDEQSIAQRMAFLITLYKEASAKRNHMTGVTLKT